MRLLALALAALTGCATIESTTQRIRVVTEPPGAQVSVQDEGSRKDLGPSPVDYQKTYDAYHCGKAAYLIPLATTLIAGGAGFGLAYATTARNDKLLSGAQNGSLFAALGLVLGVAVAAECLMKDGVTPDHRKVQVLLEASKDGFGRASLPLLVPSRVEELKLTLPKLAAPVESK